MTTVTLSLSAALITICFLYLMSGKGTTVKKFKVGLYHQLEPLDDVLANTASHAALAWMQERKKTGLLCSEGFRICTVDGHGKAEEWWVAADVKVSWYVVRSE